jgi:hypothetical protein
MVAHHSALRVHPGTQWRDVHFANDPVICTRYEVAPTAGTALGQLAEVGGAVRAVLNDAFEHAEPVRVPGGRWSLSSISRPTGSLLDLGNYNKLGAVPPSWLSSDFMLASQRAGRTPMLIAATMSVNAVNRELGRRSLALQTSGASDGQSFAGAMATGTHGADVKVGALHDTVLAVHLVVSPTLSVLIQASHGGLTDRAAQTLGAWFGIPCTLMSDDGLFRAARVHLGSLGIVLNVIVEAVALYYLERHRSPHREADSRWRDVISTRRPSGADPSHSSDPDYVQLILNPYPPEPGHEPRAWVTSMRKVPFHGQSGVITRPTDLSLKSDIADVLPGLVHLYEHDIELPGNPVLRAVTTAQMRTLYGGSVTASSALPGAMFGPPDFLGIDFDPLRGASAEYVVDAAQALSAVNLILHTLETQAGASNQYLGGLGVRFVRGSDAWLAPNTKPMNCFIELQSVFTNELSAIHSAIGLALQQAGIAYGSHWGQWFMNTQAVQQRWWGLAAIQGWKAARDMLLPTPGAKAIFGSPLLHAAGLD